MALQMVNLLFVFYIYYLMIGTDFVKISLEPKSCLCDKIRFSICTSKFKLSSQLVFSSEVFNRYQN